MNNPSVSAILYFTGEIVWCGKDRVDWKEKWDKASKPISKKCRQILKDNLKRKEEWEEYMENMLLQRTANFLAKIKYFLKPQCILEKPEVKTYLPYIEEEYLYPEAQRFLIDNGFYLHQNNGNGISIYYL